jgi:hypothetical protein
MRGERFGGMIFSPLSKKELRYSMAGKSNFKDAVKQRLTPQVRALGASPSTQVPQSVQMLGLGEILAPGGSQTVEDIANNYWFSALQPMRPVAPPTYRPRQRAFIPGENMLWTPGDDKGGIDFDILRTLADSWDILRLVIETRKDQIARVPWEIRLKTKAGDSNATREKAAAEDKNIKALTAFFACPDGYHNYRQWQRLWMEDCFVLDAIALYLERDKKKKIASVHPLDGGTVSRVITDQGLTPPSPDVAYQQVVYGIPACNLTTDDMLYVMRNERTHRRYGYPPVEQILITIGIGLKRQEFISKYYSDGNIPEALCFLPASLQPNRIREIQEWFDSIMVGDIAKRRRLTFLPGYGGSTTDARPNVVFSKEALLKDPIDEWLAQIVCYAFSVSSQAFQKMMNRATAQVASDSADEEGLEPMLNFVVDINNEIIKKMGLSDDYEFAHKDKRETDPLKQAQIDGLLTGKINTINETRKRRGDDPYPDPNADKLGVFGVSGFIPLDTPPPQPGASPFGGGGFGKPGEPGQGKDGKGNGKSSSGPNQQGAGSDKGKNQDAISGASGSSPKNQQNNGKTGKQPPQLQQGNKQKQPGANVNVNVNVKHKQEKVEGGLELYSAFSGGYELLKYSEDQARVPAGESGGGQFTSNGGGGSESKSSSSSNGKGGVPDYTASHDAPSHEPGSRSNPIACGKDLEKAQRLIGEGKHVTLDQPDEIATLVEKMKAEGDAAKAAGKTVPNWNLAAVSVPGTNLFAQDNLGIPRVDMPQLSGSPAPGSLAAALLPKSADLKTAYVDLAPQFIRSLEDEGITSTDETVLASHLRASQGELDGWKVSGMAASLQSGKLTEAPIFVTKDNYVLDGHHRWAATIVNDVRSKYGTTTMPVHRLNVDIGTALTKAVDFQNKWGIAPKGVTMGHVMKRYVLQSDGSVLVENFGRSMTKIIWMSKEIEKGKFVHPELGDLSSFEKFCAYDPDSDTVYIRGDVDEKAAFLQLKTAYPQLRQVL